MSLGNFSISKLYLKYDKKLILELDELVFDYVSSDEKVTVDDLKKNFLRIPKVLNYFRKIDIKRLKLKNNEFTILIDKDEFYIDNKDINISANLKFEGQKLHMQIYSIYLKKLNLTFLGESKIDASKQIINFFGHFNMDYVDAELNLNLNNNILEFYTQTTHSIQSLKFLKKMFRLNSVAEAWMYDNVRGDIDLKYLHGKIDLNKKSAILDSIKGKASIKDAKIQFHNEVKTVDTPLLDIEYKNDTLSFDLQTPKYNNSNINGSRVYIPNLTSEKKGMVVVDLKTESMLNDDILEILKAYDINLPLKQISGETNSSLVLKIPYMSSKKMRVLGEFKLKEANLKLNNFEFFTKDAKVILEDNMIYIKDSFVKHKQLLEGFLSLDINASKQNATGVLKVVDFDIKADTQNIIKLNNQDIAFELDFKENTKINLNSLDSIITIKNEQFFLKINSLAKIYDYSALLQELKLKAGDLRLNIKDENSIDFSANIQKLSLPLEKKGKKITRLNLKGKISENQTLIETLNKDIKLIINKNEIPEIRLKAYDISFNSESNMMEKQNLKLKVYLENSKIKLDENRDYELEYANIFIKPNEIEFEAKPLNLNLPFAKNSQKIKQMVIQGGYKDDIVLLNSVDKKIKIEYEKQKNRFLVDIKDYDLIYNSSEVNEVEDKNTYIIKAKNSNILINEKYLAKADSYDFIFRKYDKKLELNYKKTQFKYSEDFEGNIKLDAKNMSDEFLNPLINKDLISAGVINISASGKNNLISGTGYIKNSKIKDLAILNNLLILINTSPGLINPLLAIPSVVGMATSGGFNINGYRIIDGKIDFTYDSSTKELDMYKIFTKGNGIDFEGYAKIDFDTSTIDSKLNLIFFKNYSKIVGEIPVINYLFLGDEKRVDTKVEIYGKLEDPKYKTNLTKDGVSAPVNFFKRLMKTPKKIYDSISE